MPPRGSLVAPLALYVVALAARTVTAANIHFPIPEDSAYYVAAAQNLATGHGLTVDLIWSYAIPPLGLPRPAFDLWQPLGSLLAAPFMVVFGARLAIAQATSVAIGSFAAPLAWALGRRAASELGLTPARTDVTAATAGLLAAFTPLLVIQSAEPDSSAPFTVLAVAAALLVPAALAERGSSLRARALLGFVLGVAYLARQEAIYVAVAYLLVAAAGARRDQAGWPAGVRRAVPSLAVALLVVAPWFVRQALTWQASPFAQALENAWLVHQADIFAWMTRPSAAAHLALGAGSLIGMRASAFTADGVLLLATGFPAALVGLVALVIRPRLASSSSLRVLGVASLITFGIDVVVFPLAGTAGLWAHGAGPSVVFLIVLAALGLDAAIARAVGFRRWRAPTGPLARVALLAPIVALAWTVPLTVLTSQLEQERATSTEAQYGALAEASAKWAISPTSPMVTDHPMWVSAALGRAALALPRESPDSVLDLARHFAATVVVVKDPDADLAATVEALVDYRRPDGTACFHDLAAPPPFRALAIACP